MDEDKPVGRDRNDKQGEDGKKDDAKPPENIRRNTLVAAWVGLALSTADVPGMPPPPALLKVKKLLGLDQPKSESKSE